LDVVTPSEFLSEVLGDLGTRRAQIKNIEGEESFQGVRAMIPLGETFAYTTALRSITRGRATFTMEFKYYEPVPEHLLKTLINN
jgi:elongation factor G